jgi:hypothetical protein
MMPQRVYLQQLANAILQTHGVEARHIATVPVRECWQGQVAWEGEVEVFDVVHSPVATRSYGWGYPSDDDPSRYQFVCVLGIGHAEKQKSE